MELPEEETWIVSPEEAGERLDKVLARRFEDRFSRTYFQSLIEKEAVLVNGSSVKKRTSLMAGDEIEVEFLLTPQINVIPENIPLCILYEDEHLLAINKPVGMVVHPAPGHWTGTFVNALMHHCQWDPNLESLRPGIVHRLDKETSGVLIAAKTSVAHQKLVELFANRQVKKEYLAICVGNPGVITLHGAIGRHPVHRKRMAVVEEGGKPAVSHCESLLHNDRLSLVKVLPETGRTHQIRVHLKSHGTPVLGDSVYGIPSANASYQARRQLLHAHRLTFSHPISHQRLELMAPFPEDMEMYIRVLQKRGQTVKSPL